MMTRREHLLLKAMEECNEIAHRISKALCFSVEEVQPGQQYTNGIRVMQEYIDLKALIELLVNENILPRLTEEEVWDMTNDKLRKVEYFYQYAKLQGTVE